jgi:hypothetical protein
MLYTDKFRFSYLFNTVNMVLAVNQIEGSFGGQPSIQRELAYLAKIRRFERMLLSDPIEAIEWWSGRCFQEFVIEQRDDVSWEFDEIADFINFTERLANIIWNRYYPWRRLSLDNEAIYEVIGLMIPSIIAMTNDWFHREMSRRDRDECKEALMTEPCETVEFLLGKIWGEKCNVRLFLVVWISGDGSQKSRCQEIAAMTVQMFASEVAKNIYGISFRELPFDTEMVNQIAGVIVPDICRIFDKERDEVIGQLDYIRQIAEQCHF